MMMTAAGTVPPAKVLVLGAGVAGLQAIATAKRLGAAVLAFDVRPAVKEQVESLGAKFVEVPSEETSNAETKGGYAKEMSEDYKRKQSALIHETLKKMDVAIATALIPGKPAPVLITAEMVADMKPGSVIIDLAVASGGNCPLSKPDEVVNANGVLIAGYTNMASRVSLDATALYARNLYNFVATLFNKDKQLAINFEDELVKGTLLTRDSTIVHPQFTGPK
jgi:NAD(P) transhydrogenase subunit alpha